MKKPVVSALLAASLLTTTLAAPAAAQNDKNKDDAAQVTLLSEASMSWSLGASEWVNLMWTTDSTLENVEMRIVDESNGLTVEYPSDADFARLGVDSTLSSSEIDFTAVKFTTDTPGTKHATIQLSWDGDNGTRMTHEAKMRLSNKKYKGDDFAIMTETLVATSDVSAPEKNWVDLDYKGLAPTNRDMKMTVSSELPVYYPQETFTSLHHDQVLHAGEADVARVWFNPELIAPGTYAMTVTIDYVDSNGNAKSTSHEVKVTVD